MTDIDCSDCYLQIAIGDGVKRSLIRHFARFIAAQLRERRIEHSDAGAEEKIYNDAWRLASRVLREVGPELEGAIDETLLTPDPAGSVQALLAAAIEAASGGAETHYLADDLFGLDALIGKIAIPADR
jgi:hypothetical protein